MNKERPKITLQALSKEQELWKLKNGEGRNPQDLRFGQYIHIHYDMSPCNFDTENFSTGPDGFYAEKCSQAYLEIYNRLNSQTQGS